MSALRSRIGRLRGVWLAGLLALGPHQPSLAQSAADQPATQQHRRDGVGLTVEVDRQVIAIDGQVRVTLGVEAPPAAQVIWPDVGDRLGPFGVVARGAGAPSEDDPGHWQQDFVLVPEGVGELVIPALPVAIQAAPADVALRLSTDPLTITVTSVVAADADFAKPRDIAPPVALPERALLLPTWLALGLLIALAVLAALWWRRRGQGSPAATQPADALALAELEQLQTLIDQDRVEAFHIRLADVLRRYLAARFGLPAPARTTEELLSATLVAGEPIVARPQLVGALLGQCDLVKFARQRPGRDAMQAALAAALSFVQQTGAGPGAEPVLRDAVAEAS
jgi:hypothetical protein